MSSLPIIEQPPPRSAALLDHLARRMRVRTELVLGPFSLRPRHLVTLTVLRDHGEVTQQALAEVLALDSTNVVGVLNELEDQGLILRRRVPTDRRRHVVDLTDLGRERLAAAEFALAAAEDEVLASLSIEQRVQLGGLLRLAAEGLNGDGCASMSPCADDVAPCASDDATSDC